MVNKINEYIPPLKQRPKDFDLASCKDQQQPPKLFKFSLKSLPKTVGNLCSFCATNCQPRSEKCIVTKTIYSHIVTGQCAFLRKNFPAGMDFECKFCNVTISDDHKTKNAIILQHLTLFHPEVKGCCIYCEKSVSLANFCDHLWQDSKNLFSFGVTCKKCRGVIFHDSKSYFLHLKQHEKLPNASTFKRCLPDGLKNYDLYFLGLIIEKQMQ